MVTDATTESPLGLARDDKGDFFYPIPTSMTRV
jgi:hypothetical protein